MYTPRKLTPDRFPLLATPAAEATQMVITGGDTTLTPDPRHFPLGSLVLIKF